MELASPQKPIHETQSILSEKKSTEAQVFELISPLLNFKTQNSLRKTSKSFHEVINLETLKLTADECKQFEYDEYTKAMIYYARTNNETMINFILNNTKDWYQNESKKICAKLNKNIIQTYTNNSDFSYFNKAECKLYFFYSDGTTANIIKLFLCQGMNVNTQNENGDTPLHLLDLDYTRKFNTHASIDANIRNKWGNSALHKALFKNVDPGSFHVYIHDTRPDIITTLFQYKNINVNIQNNDGYTPFFTALLQDQDRRKIIEKIILLFLQNQDVDMNIKNNDGESPLHYIISSKDNIIDLDKHLDLFINRKIPINPNIQDKKGNTPLHYANTYQKIKFLLAFLDINVNSKNNLGETPLHCIIRDNQKYTYDLADTLVKHLGIDVNAKNKKGETPLMYAIKKSEGWARLHYITLLLEHNADVNLRDDYGYTNLDYATNIDNKEIVDLLIEHGAIHGSFFYKHKNVIQTCSLVGALGIISASIFAYFYYHSTSQ